uniref:Uncharacterized protein n=1 Tax=Anopheles melas TaxID=34690 RepID=A0A182TZL8_9DIPT
MRDPKMEQITYESVQENCQDFLDALLADLQNTVPGHNQQQHGGGGGSSVPGYGSLNGVRNKQQTSPVPVGIRHFQGCVRSTVISDRVLYEMYERKHDNLEKKKKKKKKGKTPSCLNLFKVMCH